MNAAHNFAIGLRAEAPADAPLSIWDSHEGVMSALEDAKVPDWLADDLATALMQDWPLPACIKGELERIVNEYAGERA